MSNPLPENIVRVVVREWLQSKAGAMDRVLEEFIQELTCVARYEAAHFVERFMATDPRDVLIEELAKGFEELKKRAIHLDVHAKESFEHVIIRTETELLLDLVSAHAAYARTRQAELASTP